MANAAPVVSAVWPLVGRDRELEQIALALGDPACPAVVISAAAGVGKSRLARTACAVAAGEGMLTLWAQATASSGTIPLGALAGVIPDEVRSDDLFDLVRRSAASLRERGQGREVVLAVDDAHLLDPVSATLVLQLAQTPDVFVVVTVRSGEPVPDAVDSLWKDAGARRIELDRLSDDAIVLLVESGLGGPVTQAATRRIVDLCAGNPLYAREVVLGAVEAGRMRQEAGLWRLDGRPGVTPSLLALIQRRIGALDRELRALLELLAVGEPLRFDEVSMLADDAVLDAAEQRAMIVIDSPAADAQVRLAHPLYGEVISADMSQVRTRSCQLQVADTLAQRAPLTPDDALRTTRLLHITGAEVPDDLLIDAAAAANRSGDPELGGELARRALDAGGGLMAAMLLARAHMNRDRGQDADSVLAGAERLAPGDPQASEYLNQRMHLLCWDLRRSDEARAFLDRATRWSDDPDWAAALATWQVMMIGYEDGFASQLPSIRQQLAQPGLPDDARRGLETVEALGLMSAGLLREAHELQLRWRSRPARGDEFDAYALGTTVFIGTESGQDRAGLRDYMQRVLRQTIRDDDHDRAAMAATMLGTLEFDAGRYHDAARWLTEAEAHLDRNDSFNSIIIVRALQTGVARALGDVRIAEAAAESMRRRNRDGREVPVHQVYLACGEGWAARARSDAEGAETFLTQAAATLDLSIRARLLHEALRAHARPGPIAQQLSELADTGNSAMIEARARHATALADRDANGLLQACAGLAAVGCAAAGVEAAVAAAEMFLAEGRTDSARRAAVVARELHPADQGWEMPAIDGLDATATELTPREAQVARLAARGLSNQQIADQLVLSVRTVETFVYRAMHKRGVRDRHEL